MTVTLLNAGRQYPKPLLFIGMVGITFVGLMGPETPFGGVKESGHGSEAGIEGRKAYLHHNYIAHC